MSSIVLLVQGCVDAHIALTPQMNNYTDDYMYEFVFGGNGNSYCTIRFVNKEEFLNNQK